MKNLYLGQICSHMYMHTYACKLLTTLDNLPLIPFQIFLVEISSYMMFIQSDLQRDFFFKKKHFFLDSIWTVLSYFFFNIVSLPKGICLVIYLPVHAWCYPFQHDSKSHFMNNRTNDLDEVNTIYC